MKTIILTLLLICVLQTLHPQYTVTKVKGRIKTSAGGYIKPGSSVTKTDILIFSSKNDKLWLITAGEGEKMVAPSLHAEIVAGGLKQALADAVFTTPSTVTLRAGISIIEKLPAAIRSENDLTDKIVVEDVNKFLFDPSVYPQNGEGEFFLQINVGLKKIPRRLRVSGDTLIIYFTDFLTETTNSGNRYMLGYHKFNSTAGTKVADIKPFFDLTNEMEDIIANTITVYKKENMPQDSLRSKAYNNVYRMSGKPNGLLFTTLFNKYWGGYTKDTLPIEPKGKGNNIDESDTSSIPALSNLIKTTRSAPPDNFSLRQYAPPVGDQEKFSTCAAWSSAYAARTIAYAVSHNYTYLEDSQMIKKNTFSPGFVYNKLVGDNGCNDGLSLRTALRFLSDSGVITNNSRQFRCGEIYMKTDVERAKGYRLKGFQEVMDKKYGEDALVTRLKNIIIAKNPVVFGMLTPDSFYGVGKRGIWEPTGADYANMDSVSKKLLRFHDGHAMCLIGYDDSVAGGSFEVMNSWGPAYARNGFYWVNYHDFFLFGREMYTISDFLPANDSIAKIETGQKEPTAKNLPSPVAIAENNISIKPLPLLQGNNTLTDSSLINIAAKPRLKGDMQFSYIKSEDSKEPIGLVAKYQPLTKNNLSSDSATNGYYYYTFNKRLFKDDQYNITLNLSQNAYLYILGADAKGPYPIFPREKVNESPLINVANATFTLPGEGGITVDSTPGKERMFLLLSKSPINTDSLYNSLAKSATNTYETVIASLSKRYIPIKESNKSSTFNKIDFDTEATDDNVLAFFIEITHL